MLFQVSSVVLGWALRMSALSFAEELFDGIEVGTVGRQEEELCAGVADGAADGLALVGAEVVHDDDVSGRECGDEELLDPGGEADAVDGAVEDAGGVDPVVSEGGEESEGAPAAVGAPCRGAGVPRGAQPLSGVMLVLAQVSSMKTRRRGSSLS